MNDNSFNIRVPKKWARVAMIVLVTALIVAPLTAIASHTFTDVPETNTFHEDIAWLADAGVTKGCNPPANTEYCPKDEVTREQMSAFMRRLAENKVVDAATAVQADSATAADSATVADSATTADDADTVDGADAADLRTTLEGLLSFGGQGGIRDIPLSSTPTTVLETTLSEADGGFALISYGFTAWDDSGTGSRIAAWIQVNDSTCDAFDTEPGTQIFDSHPANELSSLAATAVIPVSGNTTITLCGNAVGSTADVLNGHLNSLQTDTGDVTVTDAATGQGGPAAADG